MPTLGEVKALVDKLVKDEPDQPCAVELVTNDTGQLIEIVLRVSVNRLRAKKVIDTMQAAGRVKR